jgi:hypothetical protein
MPTVADYEDAVRRIAKSDVPDDATTESEVLLALGKGGPQVTATDQNGRTVAENIADALVTEEKVLGAIEASGDLPTEGEIDAVTRGQDGYDLEDRVQAVRDNVSDRVATVEDVEQAVRERKDQRGTRPTFREHVETAVDSVAQSKEFVGESPDAVATELAREIGAPAQRDFERAAIQTATQGEQTTPKEVLGDQITDRKGIGEKTTQTPLSVVRSESGETVGVVGSASGLGQEAANELGAEFIPSKQVTESMSTEGVGESVSLTLRGEVVGEVSVE